MIMLNNRITLGDIKRYSGGLLEILERELIRDFDDLIRRGEAIFPIKETNDTLKLTGNPVRNMSYLFYHVKRGVISLVPIQAMTSKFSSDIFILSEHQFEGYDLSIRGSDEHNYYQCKSIISPETETGYNAMLREFQRLRDLKIEPE